MKQRWITTQAVVLFFLSPALAELLSGSSPPTEFFHPFTLTVLGLLYGGGAIMIRELTVRWGKGWPTALLLGVAYGIIEEGLMVKSFFDPGWVDLGELGHYGRWLGVNWVWTFHLTLFHAVFSIGISILLVELMFRHRRTRSVHGIKVTIGPESWVSRRTFWILAALFVADVIFGAVALTEYRPPAPQYIAAFGCVIALFFAAKSIPHPLPSLEPETPRAAHPFWYGLTGFIATILFFLINWGLSKTDISPIIPIVLTLLMVPSVIWIVLKVLGGGIIHSAKHQLALITGAISPFILMAPLQEIDEERTDNTTGMALVGLAALIFLIWMWHRIKHPVTEAT